MVGREVESMCDRVFLKFVISSEIFHAIFVRFRQKSTSDSAAKGSKKKRKRGAAEKKAKKELMTFKSVIAMAGIEIGPCNVELEL